ncbi:MAG: glycosyltransferase family 4 protein [Beijerinckiaceae bacterium]
MSRRAAATSRSQYHVTAAFVQQRGLNPLAGLTVLQIIPNLDAGGAERTTIDVAASLAEVGARALVASCGGRMVSELQAKGGIWLPFPAATKNPVSMALNIRRLVELIGAENVDLVHARSRAPAWVAYAATRLTKTPFVTTYHGAYSGTGALKLCYNSVMARGDLVIANSHFTACEIARLYPDAAKKLRTIPRGVDVRLFDPNKIAVERVDVLRRAWNVAPDERIVLMAARLTPWKGHKIMIEAARQLAEAGLRDTKFILAGDDQGRSGYVKEIDAAIEKAGLSGIVRRTGHCTDMPAALVAAAVAVIPSVEPEAFGRVAAEALAMGTPAVVADQGGLAEIVQAPPEDAPWLRTGWLVPAGDAAALAGALEEVLALGAMARDHLSHAARAYAIRHFSLERMCGATLEAYSALISAAS